MAVTVLFEIPAGTADQYDAVIKDLDGQGLGAPDGRLYHVAQPRGEGWIVVDVWESPEKLERFAESLVPSLVRAGLNPPQPEVLPTHNIIKG